MTTKITVSEKERPVLQNLWINDRFRIAAVLVTAVNVFLVWWFRFLPLYDYPGWLCQAKILREYFNPAFLYSQYYTIGFGPIPNLTFTVLAYLLSWIMSLETAGKLLLTWCAVGFPWGIWYAVRSLSGRKDTPLEYVGFPLSFNYFFFGYINYLFAIILLIWILGYFLPRLQAMKVRHWLLLTLGFLGLYFSHGIVYGAGAAIFLSVALVSKGKALASSAKTIAALLPTVALLIWYVTSFHAPALGGMQWNLMNLSRSLFKPFLVFVKTYGIPSPAPPTILNVLWLFVLVTLLVRLFVDCRLRGAFDARLLLPALLCCGLMLLLPDPFFGVVQPGARFGLPLLILLLMMMVQGRLSGRWKTILLAASLTVTVYNTFYFQRFDQTARLFLGDMVTEVHPNDRYYVVGLDWPAGSTVWDKGSASVNGLSFVPLYGNLYLGWVTAIFETGCLQMNERLRASFPEIGGDTIQKWYDSIFRNKKRFLSFRNVVIVGAGEHSLQAKQELLALGFTPTVEREFWTIMHHE